MAQYDFNGRTFEVPDDMPLADALTAMGSATSGTSPTAPQGKEGATAPSYTKDPTQLVNDPVYLENAAKYYTMKNGPPTASKPIPQGQTLVDFAQKDMSWLNNTGVAAVESLRMKHKDTTDDQRKAFIHLFETAHNSDLSWAGAGRAVVPILTDPLNWGLAAAGGIPFLGRMAGQIAAKQAARLAILGAVEGAMTGAVQNSVEQSLKINAKGQTEFSGTEVAVAAGLGGALGGAAGAALPFIADKISDIAGTVTRKTMTRTVDPELPPIVPKDKVPPSAAEVQQSVKAPNTPEKAPEAQGEAGVVPGQTAATPPSAANVEAPAIPKAPPPTIRDPATGKMRSNPEYKVWKEAEGARKAAEAAYTPEVPTTGNPVLDAVRRVAADSGLRDLPRTRGELSATSSEAMDILIKTPETQMRAMAEDLRRAAVKGEQDLVLQSAIREGGEQLMRTTRELKEAVANEADPIVAIKLTQALTKLEKVRDIVLKTDQAFGTADGVALQARVGAYNVKDNWDNNIPSILERKGIDPSKANEKQIAAAREEVYKRFDHWEKQAETHSAVQRLDDQINAQHDSGDIAGMLATMKDKAKLKDTLVESQLALEKLTGRSGKYANTLIRQVTEGMIGNVFTTSTLVVNFIPSAAKTLYTPLIDAIARGADTAALKQMTATYGAMYSSIGAALKRARMGWEYEQSVLTGDASKLFDGYGPAIPGAAGRLIRFFPRLVQATDEFFVEVNYRGFAKGNATAEAYERGIKNGLRGKALDDFVATESKRYVDASTQKMEASQIVDFLRDKGVQRGYTGAKLDDYIIQHMRRDEGLFVNAMNQDGIDFVNDMTFKRAFSGQGRTSKLAQDYERTVNDWPILRLFGQLFFRTPVRVFEEGIRMTPGLQLIAPNFMKDLYGMNGEQKQVKAISQSMMAYALAGTTIMMYAQGRITGGGPSDWKERRANEQAGGGADWKPYSIRTDADGDGLLNFRSFDPFSTQAKIIVNAMERYSALATRQAQGEFVGKEMKEVRATIGVATGAIAQTISDANLWQGASEIGKLAEGLADPERKDSSLQRWAGQKLGMAIPNMYKKVTATENPMMNDPTQVGQFLAASINPNDPKVPKQYSPLGRVITNPDPMAALTGFHYTTREDRTKGITPEVKFVEEQLKRYSNLTGKQFLAQYKAPGEKALADTDLRTMMTADGTTTVYDKWNQVYYNSGVAKALYPVLQSWDKELKAGTRGNPSPYVEKVHGIITSYRKAAWSVVLTSEQQIMNEKIKFMKDQPQKMMTPAVATPYQ